MRTDREQAERRPSPRDHRIALVAALLLVMSWGPGSGGAVAASGDSPVFFIEEIHVETERLSREIILSESLLRSGREYTENDLREAVHRIHRLPFVLLAEFSLEKGSQRGRFDLVIKIYETRRWFFQSSANWSLNDEITRLDPRVDSLEERRVGDTVDELSGLVGRRFEVGTRGLLFATIGAEEGAFALGYQRYNLWNRNILLSLSIGGVEKIGNVSVGDSSWRATAQLGIPIRGNHALRLLAAYSQVDTDVFLGGKFESHDSEAEVAWVFNSLDDPVLPREGALMEAGLTWRDVEDTRLSIDAEGQPSLRAVSEQRTGVILSAGRHWPLADRQSVSLGARGFFEDGPRQRTISPVELNGRGRVREAEASAGHQVFLMRRQEAGRWRELRLESDASWLWQDYSGNTGAREVLQRVESWSLRTGLVYRNGWGLFRFSIDYIGRDAR